MPTIAYPVAPALTPLDGTLLDTADIVEGIEWMEGNDLWESYAGMRFGSAAVFCGPNTKDLDNETEWVNGFRFAAYGGVTCKSVGLDIAEQASRVQEVYGFGESTAIDRALMETRFRADTEVPARWDPPVDITPAAGAPKPNTAIAMLEGYYASVYVGAPTIHIPRVIASMTLGVDGAVLEGRTIRTKLGSKIAAGAGYDYPNYGPTGAEPPAMERWAYATGGVVIARGEVIIRQVLDQGNNDVVILAERAYVVAVDGPVVAIRVAVTS